MFITQHADGAIRRVLFLPYVGVCMCEYESTKILKNYSMDCYQILHGDAYGQDIEPITGEGRTEATQIHWEYQTSKRKAPAASSYGQLLPSFTFSSPSMFWLAFWWKRHPSQTTNLLLKTPWGTNLWSIFELLALELSLLPEKLAAVSSIVFQQLLGRDQGKSATS